MFIVYVSRRRDDIFIIWMNMSSVFVTDILYMRTYCTYCMMSTKVPTVYRRLYRQNSATLLNSRALTQGTLDTILFLIDSPTHVELSTFSTSFTSESPYGPLRRPSWVRPYQRKDRKVHPALEVCSRFLGGGEGIT